MYMMLEGPLARAELTEFLGERSVVAMIKGDGAVSPDFLRDPNTPAPAPRPSSAHLNPTV